MKIGNIYPTNSFGDVKIIEYINRSKVLVEFLHTNTRVWKSAGAIESGSIADRTYPSKYGKGYLGYGKYKANKGNRIYQIWNTLIWRCYSDKAHEKYPCYKEVEI